MAGAIWAIVAALSFSLGHIALAKGIRGSGIAVGTALMLAAATVVGAVSALAVDGWGTLLAGTGAGLGFFAAAGTIHFVGGWAFMNASTRLIGPSRMASITGVTPMFAAILAILFLSETMDLSIGAGILAIVAGTYFIATG
jgi:drug/metabolite transporter (DMT)-like permease